MTISVYFSVGGVETKVPDDNLMRLTQNAQMFSSAFRLGATVCREFEIDIDKIAFTDPNLSLTPDTVVLYEGLTKYATLVVDELNTDNDVYYSFSLTDKMVRLGDNQEWVVVGTWQDQIDNICTVYGLGTPPVLPQWGSIDLTWAQDMTAREFVGYLAEILSGYAYISANDELVFSAFSTVATDTIDVEDCSTFKVNESITYDRVVYDSPNRVVKYPADGNYTGTGATYYCDINNQLFTDDTENTPPTITIDDEVQYIYSKINGYTFYNITAEKCPIDGDVKCGDRIAFLLNGITYNTIAEIDWQYNSMWLGGYSLSIDNQVQEETAVSPLKSATSKITQYIDREVGEIGSIITNIENEVTANTSAIIQNAEAITQKVSSTDLSNILDSYVTTSELQQTADSLTATFTTIANQEVENQLSTWVTLDANGVTIGKSDSNIKGVFGNTSLSFVDENDVKHAWIDAEEGLGATQITLGDPDPNNIQNRWRIFVSADGNHLRFTRHN